MTKTEIKQNIHSLVETMDNENILIQVKEMLESISNESISFSNLGKDEQKSIQNGIEQLNNGEKINYEDVKKNYPEWLRK
jgi:archaellum component FlaC